jgi:LacI family transcriptional regulator
MHGQKKVILLIKPEGAYDRRLLNGIARYSHSHNSWSIFHEVEENKRALHFVKNWGTTGVIADFRETEKFQDFLPSIPLITIGANKTDTSVPNIASNADSISQMAFDHFKERGFKNFAFGGYSDLKWSRDRKNSFEKILKANSRSCDIFLSRYMRAKKAWEKELNSLVEWIIALPKPMAIFGCNDEYGRHIIEACKIAGVYIPEEVSVIGVDDDEIICNLCSPSLSSVLINTEVAGYNAAKLLDKLMDGENMVGQTIIAEPTEIVTRSSSDIFSIDDPEISRVIQFIRNNSNRPLDVVEIAEYACKSRRALYNSFMKAVGMSISEYVRSSRIKQIATLLLKTNLTLDQIAKQLGYSGPEKISRIFQKEKGTTPSEYRKKLGKIDF